MAAVSSCSSPTTHVLHRLLRPPPPPPPPVLSIFLRPFSCSSTTTLYFTSKSIPSQHQNNTTTSFSSFLHSPLATPHSLFISRCISTAVNHSVSLYNELEQEQEDDEEDTDSGNENVDNGGVVDDNDNDEEGSSSSKEGLKRNAFKVPNLTVKEKKELASYAHSLGKKLKSQLVGKSGVTDNVASSFIETLEANELLKIKIHRTCPGELGDVVQQLEEATGSVVVGQIGRTVIVYRPSLSKMEAEEKKRQARRVYVRKESRPNTLSLLQRRGQVQRSFGRGCRGSSRS